jgi:hypothetical protein
MHTAAPHFCGGRGAGGSRVRCVRERGHAGSQEARGRRHGRQEARGEAGEHGGGSPRDV